MESPSFRSSRLVSNPYPSRAFYLACADDRKALAKDATESAVGSPRRIPLPPAGGAQNIARDPAFGGRGTSDAARAFWGTGVSSMTCRSRKSPGSHGRDPTPLHIRLKAKHSRTETFQVAGWRPSTPSRPGGLIVADDDQPVAVTIVAIPDKDRQDLVDLLRRHRRHPTVTIPDSCLTTNPRLHLPEPHSGVSPRSVRSSRPTSRTGSDVPASCGHTETGQQSL